MNIHRKHEQRAPINRRVFLTHTEEIHAPAARVFPLLCPVAEYDWIDNWECRLVFAKSGGNEEGCIFTEEMMGPVLTGSAVTSTWLTNRYDEKNRRIQFIIFVHDRAVVRYDVRLDERDSNRTTAVMNFEITAMNDTISSLSDEEIKARIMGAVAFISGALKHYCETGAMLKAR